MQKNRKKLEIGQLKNIIVHNVVKSTAFIVAVLTIALTVLPLFSFGLFLLLFPVRHFEIEDSDKTAYGLNEIVTAAKIKTGNRLYFVNSIRSEKRILEELPHVKSVKIKKKFPDTICFVIQEKELGWYIEQGQGEGREVFALDYDLKVMKSYQNDREVTARKMTHLILPELRDISEGQVPKFCEDNLIIKELTVEALHKFRESKIKPRLTKLDLTNVTYNIKLTVDDTFTVDFGDMKDYETKINGVLTLIDEEKKKNAVGGNITYTTNSTESTASFQYAQPEETDNGEE